MTPEKEGLQDIMDTREFEVNIRTRWTITIRWIPGYDGHQGKVEHQDKVDTRIRWTPR